MKNKILPLVPSPYNPDEYDPVAAFDYHMQMAMRMAVESKICVAVVVDYPHEDALQTYSNVGDDDLDDEMVGVYMAAVYSDE